MTALSLSPTNFAASTLPTAAKLTNITSGGTPLIVNIPLGTAIGGGEFVPLGTASTWAALGMVPAPTGNGMIYDSTILEGTTLNGNWSSTIRGQFAGATAAAVMDIEVRTWVRSNTGVYTAVGQNLTSMASVDGAGPYTYTVSNIPFPSVTLGIGDKLYYDIVCYIYSNANTNPSATLSFEISNTANQGIATALFTSPGYTGSSPVPSGSAYPWQYFKQQLVKVYDPNGNFINVWSDAPLLDGFMESLESVTSPIRVKLPRPFDNFDEVGTTGSLGTVGQGNIVQWFLYGPGLPSDGLLRYQGVIDAFEPTINDNGEEFVTVTVTPRGSAVGDNVLIGQQDFGTAGHPATYLDPITMFNHWFQTNDPFIARPYTYPLTLDPTNPTTSGVNAQYGFLNQQLIDIFDTILLLLPPNWFWRVNVDNTVTLNQSPVTPQHTFILGRHCVSLLYTQDWTQLKNNVFVQGGIDPNTGLQITASAVGTDLTEFGNRVLPINETRIVDQATANAYAHGLLTVNDQVQYRAQLRIFDYRGDPNLGLGYDIESIKVGQTCTVIAPQITIAPPVPPAYWDQGTWDIMYWDAAPSGGAPAVPSLWDQMIWERDYWDQSPPSVTGGSSLWDQMVWDQDDWDAGPGNALGQIVVIQSLDYHFDYCDVTLAALRPSQDVALARLQAKLQSALLS